MPVAALTLIPTLLVIAPPSAQEVPLRTLPPASDRVAETFTRIVGLRELRDGRLLISDAGAGRIVIADFRRGTTAVVGRNGGGIGEYAIPTRLFALASDSTLMADALNWRWLVLHADSIVATVPRATPAVLMTRGWLLGADSNGSAMSRHVPPTKPGTNVLGKADSGAIVLIPRTTGRPDTVAQVRVAPATIWEIVDSNGKVVSAGTRRPRLAVGEEPILFPDGWLAIARLEPYRVDWRAPDGSWVLGAALGPDDVPLTDREKDAYFGRRARVPGSRPESREEFEWVSTIPPFQVSPLLPLPDGTVLIQRTPTADSPGTRYDIVDRRSSLIGRMQLPESERLGTVGVFGVYVIRTIETGKLVIQRHPHP